MLFDAVINQSEFYCIHITPETSPRPRFSVVRMGARHTVQTYMAASYVSYKKRVIALIKELKVSNQDYSELEIIAYFPYPVSTPKKLLIEGAKMRKKPDWDNVAKAVQDCIATLKIIADDNQISDGTCRKRYTTNKEGRILFKLTV